jgi:uroporphyrinogen-III synthase
MSAAAPLRGKRIVVTRAIEQSRDLKERLENLGATVLLLPAVSFSGPLETTELDRAIRSIESFAWILFTSANAVRFFAARCREFGFVPGENVAPRCAAVGPATATAAASEGFTVDYVAKEFVGSALAREMSATLLGRNVLLPRSERAERGLPNALKAAGAKVTEVVAYHTGGLGTVEPGVLDAMREGNVDVVSFFSPSAVENLRGELGPETISWLAERAAFAAVGPVTATALREAGLPVAILAAEATGESMAAAIVSHFSQAKVSGARSS